MGSKKKKNKNRFEPKKGSTVSVCYDGKIGRAVDGEVVAYADEWVEVKFKPWACEDEDLVVSVQFDRQSDNHFGGDLKGEGEGGIMRMLGCDGDWYSVLSKEYVDHVMAGNW